MCCGKQPLTHVGQEALSDEKSQAAQSHQGINAGSGCRQLLTRSASRVRLRTPHTQQCTAASHMQTCGNPLVCWHWSSVTGAHHVSRTRMAKAGSSSGQLLARSASRMAAAVAPCEKPAHAAQPLLARTAVFGCLGEQLRRIPDAGTGMSDNTANCLKKVLMGKAGTLLAGSGQRLVNPSLDHWTRRACALQLAVPARGGAEQVTGAGAGGHGPPRMPSIGQFACRLAVSTPREASQPLYLADSDGLAASAISYA